MALGPRRLGGPRLVPPRIDRCRCPAQPPSGARHGAAGAGAEPPPAQAGLQNARSVVGYNLDFPGDWTGLPPFVDLMKNARGWLGACEGDTSDCDPAAHLSVDARGWVRSLRYRDRPGKSYDRVETVILTHKGQPGFDPISCSTTRGPASSRSSTPPSEPDVRGRRIVFRAAMARSSAHPRHGPGRQG